MSNISKAPLYRGKFQKKNGDVRVMTFHRVEEMSEAELAPFLTGSGRAAPVLQTGSELVIDVEANDGNGGFRVFNHRTADSFEVIG